MAFLTIILTIACLWLAIELRRERVKCERTTDENKRKEAKIVELKGELTNERRKLIFVMKTVGDTSAEMNSIKPNDWCANLGRTFRRELDKIVINLGYEFPEMEREDYEHLLGFYHPAAIDNTLNVNQGEIYRHISEVRPHRFGNEIRHFAFTRHQRAVEEHNASKTANKT